MLANVQYKWASQMVIGQGQGRQTSRKPFPEKLQAGQISLPFETLLITELNSLLYGWRKDLDMKCVTIELEKGEEVSFIKVVLRQRLCLKSSKARRELCSHPVQC